METIVTDDNEEAIADETFEAVESVETDEFGEIGATGQKKPKKPINQQKLQDNLWGWIFCIPLIIGTVWFVYAALVMALMLSFSDFQMGSGATLFEVLGDLAGHMRPSEIHGTDPLTGLPTVTSGAADPFFWYKQAFTKTIAIENVAGVKPMNEMGVHLLNTVFYMIGIPIGMVLSMFFAVCMSRDIKGGNLFRVLYYLPCVASSIAIIYTFKIMFSTTGVINSMFGIDGLNWLTGVDSWNSLTGQNSQSQFMMNPYWCQGLIAKSVIVIMSVWKGLGGTIILYVAGLSGVNAATKEAAQIDGANGWKIFWKVTMPDLYPTIFYNIVTSVIGGMQIYAEPVLFRDESYLTSGYVSLIYRYGLNTDGSGGLGGKDPSAGAAYGMILAVIIFVLTLFQFWLDSRKKD